MKFLVDENLPPRLAAWLSARGHDAIHVSECGLLVANDGVITEFALRDGRTVVTQDADFERPATGLRVLRLGLGNASTAMLIDWLVSRLDNALARFESGETVVVVEA